MEKLFAGLGVLTVLIGALMAPISGLAAEFELLQYPQSNGALSYPAKAFRPGAFPVQVQAVALQSLPLQMTVSLTLPGLPTYEVVYDRSYIHSSGSRSFVGYLKAYGPTSRVVLTYSPENGDIVTGMINTPWGAYSIEPYAAEDGTISSVLLNQQAAGLKEWVVPDRMPVIPVERLKWEKAGKHSDIPKAQQDEQSQAQEIGVKNGALTKVVSATPTIVDVLVLYNQDFAQRYGKAALTRIDYLTTVSNQAYLDSDVDMEIRVVHTEQVTYPSNNNNDTALDALSGIQGAVDPAFAKVAAMRDQFGADLVSLIRPFDNLNQKSCGVAYVLGSGGLPVSLFEDAGYSVVSDGSNGGFYCIDHTFTHELGHNMGLAHDRANSKGLTPSWPFAYGHGIAGTFGTIMSYIRPTVGRFSNPDLLCSGSPCGISENQANTSANNRLALTRNKADVAAFRLTQVAPLVPQDGWWWNPAEAGRGFALQVSNGQLFLAGFLYSENGRADWITAIGSLWADGMRTTLYPYKDCQTLTGPYRVATAQPSPGPIYVHFSDASHGTVIWPGGSIAIERMNIVPQGLDLPVVAGQPSTGFLWDPNRSGTGFAVEVQGSNLFMVAYVCNDQGEATWYLADGAMTSASVYEGSWREYGKGQTLTGKYKPAEVVNANAGYLRVDWSAPDRVMLTLPNRNQVPLSRFTF